MNKAYVKYRKNGGEVMDIQTEPVPKDGMGAHYAVVEIADAKQAPNGLSRLRCKVYDRKHGVIRNATDAEIRTFSRKREQDNEGFRKQAARVVLRNEKTFTALVEVYSDALTEIADHLDPEHRQFDFSRAAMQTRLDVALKH
jgi:hypothetical protein